MQIDGREITSRLPPFVVAEAGGGHGGKLENAIALIHAAKDAGAQAIKFQCFEADRLTLNCDKPDFVLRDGPWKGRKLYDLYKATQTPGAWFPELFAHARAIGITIFSSVFSPEDVDFLATLDCPAYKIASMEITDTNLIAYATKTGKPLIISTGMASLQERADAWQEALGFCMFLHTVSGYPTPIEEAELQEFAFRTSYTCVGISDHSQGSDVAVAATALGAMMIEKHLALPGVETEDSAFSMLPWDFADMVKRVQAIWRAMQSSECKSEESSRQLRRSLYVVRDMKPGEPFTKDNVRSIRPSYGMAPKELARVLKSFANQHIEAGTALEEGMLLPF